MEMADAMVNEGYRDVGYEFVNIDVSGLTPTAVIDTYFTATATIL